MAHASVLSMWALCVSPNDLVIILCSINCWDCSHSFADKFPPHHLLFAGSEYAQGCHYGFGSARLAIIHSHRCYCYGQFLLHCPKNKLSKSQLESIWRERNEFESQASCNFSTLLCEVDGDIVKGYDAPNFR